LGPIVIYSADSSDGSKELLDALASYGDVHGDFQEKGGLFVNSGGVAMPPPMYRSGKRMRHGLGAVPHNLIAHDWAAICHYAVKTKDSF